VSNSAHKTKATEEHNKQYYVEEECIPKMPDFFQLGYSTYPAPADPTDDLKSCLTNEEYIKSYEKWMDGYKKASAEDDQAESNFYDDARL
jgi:hypothetical protein